MGSEEQNRIVSNLKIRVDVDTSSFDALVDYLCAVILDAADPASQPLSEDEVNIKLAVLAHAIDVGIYIYTPSEVADMVEAEDGKA